MAREISQREYDRQEERVAQWGRDAAQRRRLARELESRGLIAVQESVLVAELRYARSVIKKMRRETNEFDEGRAIADKALKRINTFIRIVQGKNRGAHG
jgi:CRISPR/Cas system-associated endoribonuclease Cas2